MAEEPIRILVVEDDVDHGVLIRRTLERQAPGCRVTVVPDGRRCLEALAGEPFAAVLLDYSLPRETGLTVLARIRAAHPGVPVVMVTGQNDERVAVEAMKAGAIDYVLKTSGYLAALPMVLHKVLKQHELAQDHARTYHEAQEALARLQLAQERLVRGETLRALGELAGGAAHHLNNLLAIVSGRAQILLHQASAEPFHPDLEIINRAAKDGAEVIRRIQEFAGTRQAGRELPVDVNQVAADVVEMTRGRWHDAMLAQGLSIEVDCQLGEVAPVRGHPAALREVFTNLIFNAADAMPRGGRITIRTWAEASTVMLSVSDNGVGMSEEVRRRALEPFFTTKGVQSTGLGLSVNYGILQRHGGDLLLESAEGHGTCVTVRLPADPAAPEEPVEPARESETPLRILLVDDQHDVREAITELIELAGHTVAPAPGPREALHRLERGLPVDLVVTDLGMPGMSGWELAAAVKARWPDLPVLLLTGWGMEPPMHPEGDSGVDAVMRKPVRLETFRQTIGRLGVSRRATGPDPDPCPVV